MNHHEVLHDIFNSVFAVNCHVEGTTLLCGALYVDPQVQFDVIRLSDNTAKLDVELPAELRGQPHATKAWDVPLKIVRHG